MIDSFRQNLRWLLLEGALIVVSILLAFWIDAWWTGKQDRKDERLVLTSVVTEFRDWQEYIEGRRRSLDALRHASRDLLEASLKSDPDISSQVIDARLADLLWDVDAALFSAPMLKSLVASGDVGRVANPDVRRELVVWSIRFDRLNSRAERATRFHDDRLLPYLEANASMPQIRNALRHAPGYPDKTENIGDINPYNVESPLDHSYLLKDSEFHALMIRHDGLISDLLYLTGGKAAANLDSMISTLEVEISKLD